MRVDVLGVAAGRGQIDREQRSRLGRLRVIRMIGVEGLARNDALAVREFFVGDVIDVWVAGDVALFLVMRLKLAEYLRRCLELVRREMLVADHQHMTLGEGLVERVARIRIDRLREVETGNLGAGVLRKRRDGEGRHDTSRWFAGTL
jgi:hypothetical protein